MSHVHPCRRAVLHAKCLREVEGSRRGCGQSSGEGGSRLQSPRHAKVHKRSQSDTSRNGWHSYSLVSTEPTGPLPTLQSLAASAASVGGSVQGPFPALKRFAAVTAFPHAKAERTSIPGTRTRHQSTYGHRGALGRERRTWDTRLVVLLPRLSAAARSLIAQFPFLSSSASVVVDLTRYILTQRPPRGAGLCASSRAPAGGPMCRASSGTADHDRATWCVCHGARPPLANPLPPAAGVTHASPHPFPSDSAATR
jgi:hypothetical protein